MARLKLLLALLAPAFAIFILPTFELLRRNTEYFNGNVSHGTCIYWMAALYFAVGCLSVFWAKRKPSGRGALYAYLLTAPLWMAYTSLFAESQKSAFYLFIPLAIAIGIYCARKYPKQESWVGAFAIYGSVLTLITFSQLFTLQQTAAAVRAEHTEAVTATAMRSAPEVSAPNKLPDIYHIILDEFQSDLFAEILDDKIRNDLSGMTWFPNASTPFGRTEMAISTLFTGIPYDYREPPAEYIRKGFHANSSMPGKLKSLGYKTIGYLHTNYPGDSTPSFDTYYFHRNLGKALDGAKARELLNSLWWFAHFPTAIAKHFMPGQQGEQLDNQALLPDDAPYISLQSFRIFMDRERQREDKGGHYYFIHLIIPHFPKVLGADCSYENGKETKILDQSHCAVKLMGEFIQMLKDSGNFDNSLLLIHGDHGNQYIKVNGEMKKAPDSYFGPIYSRTRSRPLVLVKAPGVSASQPLQAKDWNVDLLDLYPSVMDALGQDYQRLNGASLFKEPYRERPRIYHFYDKDKSGKNRIVDGTIKRYRVEKDKVVLDNEITVPLEIEQPKP